jgi:cysteinyl-tRNA synthetase
MLKLYNTLTRRKEEFRPIDPANVRLYACGPTIYDYLHIGNGRMLIVFDVLFRLLRHLYGEKHVTYARNITDVEDKINERAARDYPDLPLNDAIRKLTAEITLIFHEDAAALGCLAPTVEPRATEHIAEMRAIIERLVTAGFAYVAEGHVLFQVAKMDGSGGLPKYGALARRSLDDMIAGARVEVAPYKRDPMDFVLWKPSKPNEPGWPSPAGIATPGRPGWHIECSAMSWKHLGETFDIHGGGIDLVFPHHENEIAQSCCAFGTPAMANVWMHNGFLQVEGEKMSKSLGNFVTIRELWAEEKFGGRAWPGEVFRLAMLKTHYRQPVDCTISAMEDALKTLRKWRQAVRSVDPRDARVSPDVAAAMEDDMNTHLALSHIDTLAKQARSTDPHAESYDAACELVGSLKLLGLEKTASAAAGDFSWLDLALEESFVEVIEKRVTARLAARAAKNWAESDRIRDELAALGIALKDSKDGTTTWEVKR